MRSPHCDAIRIIFILKAGSKPITKKEYPEDVALFRGAAKLYALDFWVRNPDYLANELLLLYEETNNIEHYNIVKSILENDEPDIRTIPMTRYLFGAYEPMDDAIAMLTSRELVRISGKKLGNKIKETDFILTQKGKDFCSMALNMADSLRWYKDRAEIVAMVAGDRGGTALKEHQYKQNSYAQTKLSSTIPSILPFVLEKLENLNSKICAGVL